MKLPYARALEYLLLARNNYAVISEYFAAYKIGDVNGAYLKGFESKFRKLSNPDELGYLDKTAPTNTSVKDQNGHISIKIEIPQELIQLKEKLKIDGSPFSNSSIKLICENIVLRRSVEVYLTSRMKADEITSLINDKFRIKLTPEDVTTYRRWFYDCTSLKPDDLDDYFHNLSKEEKDYKLMAYMNKEDYVKWKMQDDCNLDPQTAVKKIMADAFYNLQETLKENRINHAAAKTWSDIFFKALDYVNKDGGATDTAIFSKFKFVLNKEQDVIIPFEELLKGNGK